MSRVLRLILVTILLITCSGCIWVHDRGWRGDHDRGEHGDRGNQDRERHYEHEERY